MYDSLIKKLTVLEDKLACIPDLSDDTLNAYHMIITQIKQEITTS